MTADGGSATTVGDLELPVFAEQLRGPGVGVRLGPFDLKLISRVRHIERALHRLYRDYPLIDDDRVFSMHARLTEVRALPRLYRKLVRFTVDGRAPHEDLPLAHSLAVLEWGINLVIALRSHSLLMLHAAAVEKFGAVMLLPAMPGEGKTTLCCALSHRGWRLFSDEFGLVRPSDGVALPLPRPMPLKNESIDVIRAFSPDAEFGPRIENTRKGTVVHVKAPAASVRAAHVPARPRWIVFPRWQAGAQLTLEPVPKGEAFMLLATNAFNYEVLGERGFATIRDLIEHGRTLRLVYSDLDSAVEELTAMAADDGADG